MSENEIKGILGTKLGMTQVFDEDNRVIPVTVVEAGPCVVTQIRTTETDGYNAIQIAYGEIDPRKVNKPGTGHFKKAGVTPRRHVTEIRMDDVSGYEVGQDVTVDIFDGIAFVARIMVEPASNPNYKDANKLANVVTPDEPQYAAVLRGETVPPDPVNAKPCLLYTSPSPRDS